MSSKRKLKNVRREYRQSFISGFEHLAQSRDENGNRKTDIVIESSKPVKRGARSYKVSVTFFIDQISNDSDQYDYRILLNDDPDISVTPYSIRSKKEVGQTSNLPAQGIKGGDSFSMVYGIHKSGEHSLSHTNQHPLHKVAPQVYSFILGAIDRAIECTILVPENEAGDDDTGKRTESTRTPKDLGADKEKRRSKKVRAKVLPETLPEEAAVLDEDNGSILGRRQGDTKDRPGELGSGTDNGGAITFDLGSGQPPDIGF